MQEDPYSNGKEKAYTKEERNWAVILHLSVLSGFLVPWAGFVVPFAIWLVKRNDSDYLDRQGKEVMNFLLTILIVSAIGAVLSVVLIGIAILAAMAVIALVMTIIAAIKVSDGEDFRYPYILRLIH